jgi:hypothetical protein
MKDDTLPTTSLLSDISSLSWALRPLLNRGKEYDELLSYIIDKNWYYPQDGKIEIPAVKDLIKDTGIPYGKLKKHLNAIFEDIRTSDTLMLSFPDVEFWFSISSFRKSLSFRVKSLAVIPRIGEQMRIPYFRAYLLTDFFYVSDITHEFENGKQVITVHLKEGFYNLFWHFRLDEAEERMEIDFRDRFEKTDYQLKKELDVIPKWAQ